MTAEEVPSEFLLAFSKDGNVRRLCRVVWRNGNTVGVRFLPRGLPVGR
jgi:hypothetical protein